jgi:hypothetical protein
MAKELSNNEHNAQVFVKINKLEESIKELKLTLKKTEKVNYTSLADCNAMTQKHKKQAAKADGKAK